MTTEMAERPATTIDYAKLEDLVIHGNLGELTPQQRVAHIRLICESTGLNPLTQPFAYIVLNNKLQLYALKGCTDQLRRVHTVSVQIVAREVVEDTYVVTARATLPNGRQDESIGAVAITGLKGDARANAMMKAETKAKRRVTLSICGLGMLDETEVETIPNVRPTLFDKVDEADVEAARQKAITTSSPPPIHEEVTPAGDTVTFLDNGTGEEVTLPKPTSEFPWYVCHFKIWPNGFHESRLQRWDKDGVAISLVVTTKTNISDALRLKEAYDGRLPVQVASTPKVNDTKKWLQEVHIGPKLDQPF